MNILRDMQPHFAFEVSTLSAVEQKYARWADKLVYRDRMIMTSFWEARMQQNEREAARDYQWLILE